MNNIKRSYIFLSLIICSFCSGVTLASKPLPVSKTMVIEGATFFLKKKATDTQDGKIYFKLPCARCPKTLSLPLDTQIWVGDKLIPAKSLFINKNYTAAQILFDRKKYEAVSIEIFSDNQ